VVPGSVSVEALPTQQQQQQRPIQADSSNSGSENSVQVRCSFLLKPGEKQEDAEEAVAEGVGVGEVGGAHWLSESQPTSVNVAAAEEQAAAAGTGPEGSISCTVTYTGEASLPCSLYLIKKPHGHTRDLRIPWAARQGSGCQMVVHALSTRSAPSSTSLDLAAVQGDGGLLMQWEVDARQALPTALAPGLDK